MSILDGFCVCVGKGVDVDGGWLPLPTRVQRYCDPASLVFLLLYLGVLTCMVPEFASLSYKLFLGVIYRALVT